MLIKMYSHSRYVCAMTICKAGCLDWLFRLVFLRWLLRFSQLIQFELLSVWLSVCVGRVVCVRYLG